jgi:hypothetical protein
MFSRVFKAWPHNNPAGINQHSKGGKSNPHPHQKAQPYAPIQKAAFAWNLRMGKLNGD